MVRQALWAALVLFAGSALGAADAVTVATVDDEEVSAAELRHWMLLERAAVARYFFREHGVRDAGDLWRREFGGESPAKMLRERALREIVRIKVQQLLAREKGIVDTANFLEIMEARAEVNRTRRERIERGGVVYGPPAFTPRVYFDHVFDRMVEDLKAHLSETDFKLSDAELMDRFRDQGLEGVRVFEQVRGALQMQYVDETYDRWVERRVETAVVRIHDNVFDRVAVW
jgi:hypothetical protein